MKEFLLSLALRLQGRTFWIQKLGHHKRNFSRNKDQGMKVKDQLIQLFPMATTRGLLHYRKPQLGQIEKKP